jgi:hypothetical protein
VFSLFASGDDFEDQLQDYLNGTGTFAHIQLQCIFELQGVETKVIDPFLYQCNVNLNHIAQKRKPDPLNVFNAFCFAGQPLPPFIALVCWLLSVSANLASCEQLFSVFGNMLTKLRTQLKTQTLMDLSELKMHVCDEHIHGDAKQGLKCCFGNWSATAAASGHAQSCPPTPTGIVNSHHC